MSGFQENVLNGRNFPVLVYKSEIWVELRCLGGALGALMARAGEREVTQTSTRHTHVMLLHYITSTTSYSGVENSC